MSISIPERDWKYLRGIKAEMLSELCGGINQEAADILGSEGKTEHEKYLKLYKHIEESDKIVGDCFNDWRRSNLRIRLLLLHRYKLLTDERIGRLSEESRELIRKFQSAGYE